MKHWTQKAISLLLLVVMVAAMIPPALFTTSALDYSKTEFLIANVNDWNDIAAYSVANPNARFTCKTIKPTKNIDFGGATIPTLFASNFEVPPSYAITTGLTVTEETISITYDENGQHVKEREFFDVDELVSAPTVRVMSSNILNVDNSASTPNVSSLSHEQSMANMATMFMFSRSDFIGMNRWQWAVFQNKENPDWKFILLNLHGANNNPGASYKDFQPTFFASVNA